MDAMRLCAISVDLDEIPNYFAIHGLSVPEGAAKTAVYDVAVERLSRFASASNVPLTLFTIGSDLLGANGAKAAAVLKRAAGQGHELANHSLDHLYDLTKQSRAEIRRQIEGGADAIEQATGVRPTGFRAPGYTITDEVFSVLEELGVTYDSSVFPCPAYWAAKSAAIGWISLRGRSSRSVLDTPNVLRAPTRPYRAGEPYWTKGQGVRELPVQVTRGARLPVIGTTITLAGPTRARLLARMCVGEPLISLELHGIDVLDEGDGLEALRPHQPDVRVPVKRKLDALAAVVETLRDHGYTFVTCAEAAKAALPA